MKIAIGSDHAGFPYKKPIIDHLSNQGIETIDKGCYSDTPTDYPIYAVKVAEAVRDKEVDYGILICGTGIGMSIAANKVHGIRAGACQTEFVARSMKEHNHANVLCLGSRTNTLAEVLRFVDLYLGNNYSPAERHLKRLELIHKYEEDSKWEK
ncbi:MAG: ribose 5-phosphate isomerase B [Candidatus Izemoplasmatales bacterium]|nr:ribose 5-phosphate isomerase B [Candidatus Izemoplasmatales bacterium]